MNHSSIAALALSALIAASTTSAEPSAPCLSDEEVRAYLATSGLFQLGRYAGACWKYSGFRERWPSKIRNFENAQGSYTSELESTAVAAFERAFPGRGSKMMDSIISQQAKGSGSDYSESQCDSLVEAIEGMTLAGRKAITMLLIDPYYVTARNTFRACSP